jgi:glycosyltransferase involved in cell wall biosynthesis
MVLVIVTYALAILGHPRPLGSRASDVTVRILHVVPSYYPAVRYGGPIRSVHGLACAFAHRGHEVHVYTTNVDGPSNSDVPLQKTTDLDGVSVRYFPTGAGRRLYRSPDMDRALQTNISSFDVVHTHSVFLWPTTSAARAARANAVPYLLAPRGMLVADLIRRKSTFAKLAWMRIFERDNIEKAAAIHATSRIEADDINRLGLHYRRMIIVANGTQLPGSEALEQGRMANLSDRPKVAFLGRLNWKKGLDRLIEAMADLPEADLIVAGDDEEGYRVTVEALARNLGVISRVSFVGPIDGPEKWKLLASAQVLALPSYSENFGNVVLEAMAAGCPVVVTPEVGSAGVVRDAGAGLVVRGDAGELARALRTILSDRDMAQTMGDAGRKIVAERFNWECIAEEMERAYKEVIDDCKRVMSQPTLSLAS